MAHWKPVANLRSQIIHHPPVTVFFVCLLLLAGAFISIGLYSRNHDIKNPDIYMDWNRMLVSLADWKFCTHLNDTDLLNFKPDMISPPLLDHADVLIKNTQQKSEDVITMFLLVPLIHVGDDLDHKNIRATLLGSQLDMKGSAGKQSLNISLFLDLQTCMSGTDSESIQKPSNKQSKPPSSSSCLKITAPRYVLPHTPPPPQCPCNKKLENDMSPVRAHAVESYTSSNSLPCLSLKFTPDPKLTVLLTQDEKALARYHLLLVSIVLLILCIMMCLFGTLTCSKSRRHLVNDPQKETLLE
ncbi:transmembrane protein 248 isoform X2 [Neoarius graeffei]|nr:transmembrane protein 248 isoform X2 [Neoarius graeffei]XP_060770658.1 transmembrane protein 248 isoform X2 [Neoarius graeffei]XP_060770659.1 transmembrane protein 248 isoform X2 [Neoarius graeffei]